jgi:hypothetical protein
MTLYSQSSAMVHALHKVKLLATALTAANPKVYCTFLRPAQWVHLHIVSKGGECPEYLTICFGRMSNK